MVKVDIISGFLGAGKTTLIKKLLEEKFRNEKLVIIENEFGEIGIDGSILKSTSAKVREINSGCICCSLVGDFGKAVEEVIAEYKPDRIIIEPSGVGKLSDIIKACDTPKLQKLLKINMLIAVVDALKYQIYVLNFGEFFENQIKNAKTIVLSRTQKTENRKLEAIVNSIRKLNDKANIITTPWDCLSSEIIISAAEEPNQYKGCKCGCNHDHDHLHSHNADEVFDVWGVESPKKFDKTELKSSLELLGNKKAYGMVLRGKGIVQLTEGRWLQFDYTPGELEIKEASAQYTGRLCIIGKDLKKCELSKLFGVSV